MRRLVSACVVLVGVIHLLPLAGALGAARLEALYGVPATEPNLEILLRHRAVLFGALGALLVGAAFRPHLQAAALAVGAASVVGFLALAYAVGDYNTRVARVVAADWVALAALAVAGVAYWRARGA